MAKLMNDVKIEESWKKLLHDEFQQPYFSEINHFLEQAKAEGKQIYPSEELIFNAFDTTPVNQVKVVIIGQDPYHGPNQAMGLSFSVPSTEKVPSSLQNIYKELVTDIPNFEKPKHGDLTKWAEQGVFLLNACLTVEHKTANAHKNIGWHQFTDAVIRKLSTERTGLVFLLWGNFAKKKKALIDTTKHHVLESVHPSGLSAHRGFFGCKHFSQTNELLEKQELSAIDLQV
jgi:uracil-DNA glycosylase